VEGEKKPDFNINSNNQLAWLLFDRMKLPFGNLTASGKVLCKKLGMSLPYTQQSRQIFIDTCTQWKGKEIDKTKVKDPWCYMVVDKKTLGKFSDKYRWIERFLERQKKAKLLSTYVEGIQKRAAYGVIQPSFLQHGTTSGRYSSRDPNFQNLPREDKSIKSLIQARPGHIFVGADYSQLEPRVFAYFSGDKRLLAAFSGDTDFYSVIGMEVYQKVDCVPFKEGRPDAFGILYKDLRNKSKVIALASTYGASARQLASTTGKSVEETQKDIDAYFTKFPGVKEMMLKSHEMAKKTGKVENLFGRPRRIPEAKTISKLYRHKAHDTLPYEYRSMLNLAVNHRIQSTGASIVNRSAIAFHSLCKQLHIEAKLVAQVHDSLVVECAESDAQNVKLLLQSAMEDTIKLEGIKLEAIPKIGKTLADV
jgi:DNA polymerase-1